MHVPHGLGQCERSIDAQEDGDGEEGTSPNRCVEIEDPAEHGEDGDAKREPDLSQPCRRMVGWIGVDHATTTDDCDLMGNQGYPS